MSAASIRGDDNSMSAASVIADQGNRVRQSEKRFPLFEYVLNFELAHPERFLKFPNGEPSHWAPLSCANLPFEVRATRSRSRDFAIIRIRHLETRGIAVSSFIKAHGGHPSQRGVVRVMSARFII